ncbi:MAG TPA: LysR substrate-binding domain-containing protein [Rhizomicrobium sp.]|nr:LysR substrate-binding domain-containing protein [Rhizomicrobium sp.]
MRRLPPLTALRVFEAVGRAGNVRFAAQELNVTPAAVSHQIRLLEEHFGTELFIRSGRGLILTQAGTQFLHHVSEAFDRLADAVRKIPGSRAQTVRVHSLPSFASCWLVPRLAKFYAAHPGIDVEITTVGDLAQPPDLANLDVDFAVRVGLNENQWAGVHVEKLVHEQMFPVCAPEVMQGVPPLKLPRDMSGHALLQVSRRSEGWPEWLAAAKANGMECCEIDPDHGPKFDTIQMTFTAAVEGMGIAMGRLPIVEDYLASGALVEPFALRVTSRNAYWLLSASNTPLSQGAATFRAWMRRELDLSTD